MPEIAVADTQGTQFFHIETDQDRLTGFDILECIAFIEDQIQLIVRRGDKGLDFLVLRKHLILIRWDIHCELVLAALDTSNADSLLRNDGKFQFIGISDAFAS